MREWKFFDCNAMIGNTLVPVPAPLLDAGALLHEMDRFGIEATLFYHNAPSKHEMNHLTLETARKSKRLVPCWVLPVAPVRVRDKIEDQVDAMLEAGVRAARFVPDEGPQAAPLTLRVYALEKVFEKLNRHRVPVMIAAEHFQMPVAANTYGWDQVNEICTAFPALPLILLQPRYAAQTPLIAAMRRHRNLYFTIPWYGLFHQLESIVEMFGPERALFGTNLPHIDPALPVGMVNYGSFTVQEKKQIAGDNLRGLLRNIAS
jgi:predicted TIM-barrel fold metal-dependent hydrolase